ncbi:hypothetical protein [Nibribacter koreensis]|uniref:hypothetical protein n=1 Tax=Nibribacter koreensis TaxID=1084519 RepID=UPI0031EE6213
MATGMEMATAVRSTHVSAATVTGFTSNHQNQPSSLHSIGTRTSLGPERLCCFVARQGGAKGPEYNSSAKGQDEAPRP